MSLIQIEPCANYTFKNSLDIIKYINKEFVLQKLWCSSTLNYSFKTLEVYILRKGKIKKT